MTVNTISSIAEFVTNGVTTNYPFYFKFLANEDLVVTYVDPLGISSELTLGTHYTVNGAGTDQGGSVVTTTALTGPGQLVVSREMEAFQQTSLRNQGKFLAETHEDVFDKLTMLIQQGFAIFTRALTRPFGRDYFYAENRRITNVQDPIDQQDAATRNWSEVYLGGLVSGLEGNPNIASGVGYVTPRGALGFVQDMSNTTDPLKGAGYVARALRHINSLAELRTVRGQYDGEVIYLRGRTALTPGSGAGVFAWLAASTATDDDGYTINSTGTGCWIRQDSAAEIDAAWYGASVSSSSAVNTAAIQAAINTATASGLNTVRLPGKGIIAVGVLTGVAAITFVSNGAFFSDYLNSVEQDVVRKEVVMPAAFSWLVGKFYTGGAPGLAKTTVTVEGLWKNQESQGIVNYYVDPASGLDTNPGNGTNAPLKTIAAAIGKADVGVINLKGGTYYETLGNVIGVTVNRDIQIKSWSGGNDVIIRNGIDSSAATWTIATGSTYQATISQTIFRVMDKTVVDARGDYLDLKPQTSIANVNANPGSYWYDSATGIVYVRMHTNRTPSGDALLLRANTSLRINGNRAIFLKNLRFEGGTGVNAVTAGGVRPRIYAVDSSFRYSGSNGVDTLGATAYLERCTIAKAGLDNLNYHDDSGLSSRALEIDVISYGAGDLASRGWNALGDSQNASTMHDTGSIVRVGGDYTESYGPVIADTGASSSMNIGSVIGKSLATATQNTSVYSDGGMALVDAALKGSTYDIRVASGGTVLVRNPIMGGSILREGGGTVQQF